MSADAPGESQAAEPRRAAAAGAGEVRAEDAFDVEAVHSWLGFDGGPPAVRQFSGGASNLTYLLSYPDRDLILRRPPPGVKAASAHDMQREHRIQAALRPAFRWVPEMVALCLDHDVIGCDFYVMKRIEGPILHREARQTTGPDGRPLDLDAAAARRLCESALDRLVELHRVDPRACGLDDLGKGDGYVERQVTGWSRRYEAARTWNVPSFRRVMRWLQENRPGDAGACVIHNDYRLDNLVLGAEDLGEIVGVLDWEMATVGDPLMDLGCSLAYWVQADDGRPMQALRRQPSHLPGMLGRAELVQGYARRSGRSIGDFRFYEVFGLFRLAGIIQQIYRRYHLGQTRNPAFRHYWLAVVYLERRCRRIIAGG